MHDGEGHGLAMANSGCLYIYPTWSGCYSSNLLLSHLYLQEDFNVDQFVVECRRRVPLENLRNDLSVYLKILQSAMIELINKDYADFVNLSTNLVKSSFCLGTFLNFVW